MSSKIKNKIFPNCDIRKGKIKMVRKGRKGIKLSRRVHKRKIRKILLLSNNKKRNIATLYIQSTRNNTIFTASRGGGNTRFSVSTGMCGFKNTRQSTSYASQMAAEKLVARMFPNAGKRRIKRKFSLKIKGLGAGKLSGVRALKKLGLKVRDIQECTSLPHNGCRPPKVRRL